MITPHQLNLLTEPVNDIYESLEMEMLKVVVKRLKVSGEANISEYHMKKLSQLHLLNREVEEYLSMATGIARDEIRETIMNAGYEVVKDTDEYMKRAGMDLLPTPSLDPIMESYINQTFRELDNFVNQTLITTNFGEGTIAKEVRKIVEQTTMKMTSGLLTLEEAVEDTVLQWADKGVPSTFIDKGGHTWSMERYTRTVIRSTNSRIYNELRTNRMAEYEVHTVLMGSKPKARPACALCQGKVLDMRMPSQATSGYPSIYEFGYGTPAGTLGINCTHPIYPFIPGVSTNNQLQYSSAESIKNERIEQQRKEIARRIVKTKKNLMVTEELNSPKQDHYRALLNKQQAQMRKFIQDNKGDTTFKLRREYDLENVYTPLATLVKDYKEKG